MPGYRSVPVDAGNEHMIRGGADEGTNMPNQLIVLYKESEDRRHVYSREFSMETTVFVNGSPVREHLREDVRCGDYRGLIRGRNNRVGVLQINPNPAQIGVPFSVRIADGTVLDGTIVTDVVCDPFNTDGLLDLLNSDYSERTVRGSETVTRLTADGIRWIVANVVSNSVRTPAAKTLTTFDNIDRLAADTLTALRRSPSLSLRGIKSINAQLRFSETTTELLLRLATEQKVDLERTRMKYEARSATLTYALDEYDMLSGRRSDV